MTRHKMKLSGESSGRNQVIKRIAQSVRFVAFVNQ